MTKGETPMWQAIRSVLAAFFGVRKEQRRRQDFEQNRPGLVIAMAVLLAIVLAALVAGVALLVAR